MEEKIEIEEEIPLLNESQQIEEKTLSEGDKEEKEEGESWFQPRLLTYLALGGAIVLVGVALFKRIK